METKILKKKQKTMVVPLQIKSCSGDEQGVVSGYASVFNVVDAHSDVILPGAFAKCLERQKSCSLLWQHEQASPVGVINEIYEDEYGLFMKAKILLDVEKGKETYSLVKNGALGGLSIGFTVNKSYVDYETEQRFITEVDLWEVSFVTFPANGEAIITSVKSNDLMVLSGSIDRAIKVLKQ